MADRQPISQTQEPPGASEPPSGLGVRQSPGALPFSTKGLPPRVKVLATLTTLLVLCFGSPLFDLARFAIHNDLYSHILLIPFICVYLVWLKRSNLEPQSPVVRRLAVVPFLAGLVLIATYGFRVHSGWKPATEDYLSWMTMAFLSFFLGCCFALLGKRSMRALAFPLALLIFMVPFPEFVRRAVESFLQHGSAQTAFMLLDLSGMPVFRQGTNFQLPGFSMEVAPQCSGIHSSLVLFISSLLAGHLLLSSRAARFIVVLAIIPLALLRNGFRIFVLAQLCVRVNPDWINSDLHHRGGPVFFALSLIPFLFLLFLLRKWERRKIQPRI